MSAKGVMLVERKIIACNRCADTERPQEKLGWIAYCRDCISAILKGEQEHIRIDPKTGDRCTVCYETGAVAFETKPTSHPLNLILWLCQTHLRDLFHKNLGPHGFDQLRKSVETMDLSTDQIFLLRKEFYDINGHALQAETRLY